MALVLISFLFYQAQAYSLLRPDSAIAAEDVSPGIVYLSGSEPSGAEVIQAKKAPMREVHIANTGFMLLRGATVISSSGSTVRVSMAWGSSNYTWTLETNNNTRFLNSKGEKGILRDVEVGDLITVTGMLTESGAEPTIDTEFVREQEA